MRPVIPIDFSNNNAIMPLEDFEAERMPKEINLNTFFASEKIEVSGDKRKICLEQCKSL